MKRALPADFWLLWYVGTISSTVRWLETVAVGVVVYQQTGSPFIVAMMTMLRLLPMGLFGAFLGALAERFDRRVTLALMILLLALTSSALAALAWSGPLSVWQFALSGFLNGCAWATDNPLRRAMIGEVVGRERMATAMALDVGAGNVSRILGPTVGGLLLVQIGLAGIFTLSTLCYATAIAATLAVRNRAAPALGAGAVLRQSWEAITVVFADRRLAAIMIVTIVYNVFGWPATSMVPVIGRDSLLLGPEGVGFLTSVDGVGAFAGALFLAMRLAPGRHGQAYVASVAVYLLGVIAFALAPHPLLAGGSMLVTGLSGGAFATFQATLVYLAARPEMRSRALGVLSVCVGTGPIGFVWLGWLANQVGAAQALVVTGVLGLLALAATQPLWRRI